MGGGAVDGGLGPSKRLDERDLDRCDPDTLCTVEVEEKVRRGRSRRCNLYSVGPSCGSASSLVILKSSNVWAGGISMPLKLPIVDAPLGREVVEGATRGHGEANLTGSVSYVKIEAILTFLWEI